MERKFKMEKQFLLPFFFFHKKNMKDCMKNGEIGGEGQQNKGKNKDLRETGNQLITQFLS